MAVDYAILPEVSAVLIQARSNVGPIELASTTVTGHVHAYLMAGRLAEHLPPTASLSLPVDSLHSGNPLYDNEIHRRLDSRRYPSIVAELATARMAGGAGLTLSGRLTIHGESRELTGSAEVLRLDETAMQVVGEQLLDIRDFSISLPNALMLRIYPEVVVRFRVEGGRVTSNDSDQR